MTRRLLPAAFLALASLAFAADSGFKSIFNGKDLSGWEGLADYWSVRDGAITGQTTAEKIPDANTFLIWKGGELANFELRAMFKLSGENDKGFANSGVQYRSHIVDPAKFIVGGYQADMDLGGTYTGMLYEERGRGILMKPGQKIQIAKSAEKEKPKIDQTGEPTDAAKVAAAYKKGEWNEIAIIARGNHLQHFINGVLIADVTDQDDVKGAKSGILALQLHKGPPMTVQFKNLQLKTLP